MADPTPGTVPVVDHRRAPAGLMPRAAQTWLMGALALGIIGLIVITGRPQPAPRETAHTDMPPVLNPDRVREYQEQLRSLESRARAQAPSEPPPAAAPMPLADIRSSAPVSPPDPEAADRTRREADSLFSSTVVLSRRPDTQRLTTGETALRASRGNAQAADSLPTMPSLDDVTTAVIRATTRSTPTAPSCGAIDGAPHVRRTAVSRATHPRDAADRLDGGRASDSRRHRDRHRVD